MHSTGYHHFTMGLSIIIRLQLIAYVLLALHESSECCSNSSDINVRNIISSILPETELKNGTALETSHRPSRESKSRRKRYVAFPEGSSFSVRNNDYSIRVTHLLSASQVAFCATVGFVGNPNFIYFSWAINWGLAYDLPNETWILNQRNRKPYPKPIVQRRHRRELFEKLEVAIDK